MTSELLTSEIKQIQDLLTAQGVKSIQGKVFFSVHEQDDRASHSRFFIDDTSQEEAKTSKFRFAMQELLDKLIIDRSKAKLLKQRQGVIELTDDKASIEWLDYPAFQTEMLLTDYKQTLSKLDINQFNLAEDRYSGVFLPYPLDAYWQADIKLMVVGRETAGWNTLNNKNTIQRVHNHIKENSLDEIILEATERHKKHLQTDEHNKIKTKSPSRFKQYFFKLAKELNLSPDSLIYSNLYAWDYNNAGIAKRPAKERKEIQKVSLKLLAAQIHYLQPDYIVFAAGLAADNDQLIKRLFNEEFNDGYETIELHPKKLWIFRTQGATCFRITHPAAIDEEYEKYKKVVIDKLKEMTTKSK